MSGLRPRGRSRGRSPCQGDLSHPPALGAARGQSAHGPGTCRQEPAGPRTSCPSDRRLGRDRAARLSVTTVGAAECAPKGALMAVVGTFPEPAEGRRRPLVGPPSPRRPAWLRSAPHWVRRGRCAGPSRGTSPWPGPVGDSRSWDTSCAVGVGSGQCVRSRWAMVRCRRRAHFPPGSSCRGSCPAPASPAGSPCRSCPGCRHRRRG